MTSEQARALWAMFRDSPDITTLALGERRAAAEMAEALTSEPAGVVVTTTDSGALMVTPPMVADDAAILYLFGGGYVMGSAVSRRKTAGHIASAARRRVLVANYRLAPEHPHPAALDDARAAFDELVALGFAPQRIFLCGDSAGGGLAFATAVSLRDDGVICAGVIGLSPWTDLTLSGESMDANADVDVELTHAALQENAQHYLAGSNPEDPHVSPLFADMTGMPPALLVVGADELLLDDSLRMVRRLAAAGVTATLILEGGCQHVYPLWSGALPEADDAILAVGAWVERHVATNVRRP